MGSILSGPKVPNAPVVPAPPPVAAPATMANSQVVAKMANARKGSGGGTNPTGSQGLSEPPTTANATLLGQ